MLHYWADALAGDDTTGDGSSGNPWQTLQKICDESTDFTGGITWHLVGTFNVTSGLNVGTGFGSVVQPNNSTNIFIIQGESGTTLDLLLGQQAGCIIDGGGTAGNMLNNSDPFKAIVKNIHFTNYTATQQCSGYYSEYQNCVFSNSTADSVAGFIFNCKVHDNVGNATVQGTCNYCIFRDNDGYIAAAGQEYTHILNCVFDDNFLGSGFGYLGYRYNLYCSPRTFVQNCTFICRGGRLSFGIRVGGTQCKFLNNLFVGFNGGESTKTSADFWNDDGSAFRPFVLGYNSYYNSNKNLHGSGREPATDLRSFDITESILPIDLMTYKIVGGALSINSGLGFKG